MKIQNRKWLVSVKNQAKSTKLPIKKIKLACEAALKEVEKIGLPPELSEISLTFISDRSMQKLNKEFRHKDKPTDVLSFPQIEDLKGRILSPSLGDIVISIDTAKRQAREYGVTLWEEILRLMIHGTLHLTGFDHENVPAKEAVRMRRFEKKILKLVR